MFDETNTKDWQQSGNGVFLLREIPGQWIGTGPERRPATENEFSLSVHHTDRDRLIETVIAGKIADALNAAQWQSEQPTDGRWWLAVRPDLRGRDFQDLSEVYVNEETGEIWIDWPTGKRVSPELLDGARWLKRETPSDPFAQGG